MEDINLKKYLKEGVIIRTKIDNSYNWVSNLVYEINDDCIEIDIGLDRNYIDNLLMVGDTITCKYLDEQNEYTFMGWVTKIKAEFPQKSQLEYMK